MVGEKLLVKLDTMAARILKKLVDEGHFNSREEALHVGILRLGQSYGLLEPRSHDWKELGIEIVRSKRRLTHEQIVEAIKRLDRDT